jgi:hypothetical protein
MHPVYEPVSAVVMQASLNHIDSVIVAGRQKPHLPKNPLFRVAQPVDLRGQALDEESVALLPPLSQ